MKRSRCRRLLLVCTLAISLAGCKNENGVKDPAAGNLTACGNTEVYTVEFVGEGECKLIGEGQSSGDVEGQAAWELPRPGGHYDDCVDVTFTHSVDTGRLDPIRTRPRGCPQSRHPSSPARTVSASYRVTDPCEHNFPLRSTAPACYVKITVKPQSL